EGEGFDGEDRVGRYVYGSKGSSATTLEDRSRFGSFSEALVQGRKLVGAKASRMLPTVTRMEVGAYHTDYLYFSGQDAFGKLPRTRDQGYVSLVSERPSLRFKPFAFYRISRFDDHDWDQER